MLTQELVEKIAKENSVFNYKSQETGYANSLRIISEDIYSHGDRFIYELIQNAEDSMAGYQASNRRGDFQHSIRIEFTQNFIVVSHSGRPFSSEDLEALCQIGVSSSQKKSTHKGRIEQIGYKGIGFKSVFAESDYVLVRSENTYFRFDRSYCMSRNILPWQIVPLWTDTQDIPKELRSTCLSASHLSQKRNSVSTAIRRTLKDITSLKKNIKDLIKKSEFLLFLQNIRIINLEDTYVRKTTQSLGNSGWQKVVIDNFGEIESSWLVRHDDWKLDDSIKKKLKEDEKCPDRLKLVKRTRLSIAAKLQNNSLVSLDNESTVFVYLPTEVRLGLPFLLNGDFLVNASRENMKSPSVWNEWLIQHSALSLLVGLHELLSIDLYKFDVAALIPKPRYRLEKYYRLFIDIFKNLAESEASFGILLGNTPRNPLKVDEACWDSLNLCDVVENHKVENFLGKKLICSQSRYIDRTLGLFSDIKQMSEKDIKKFINQECAASLNVNSSFNMISHFYKLYINTDSSAEKRGIIKSLKQAKLFIDRQGQKVSAAEDLCIPSKNLSFSAKDLGVEIKLIDLELLEKLKQNKELLKWISDELGVKRQSKSNFFEKILNPKITELTSTKEKSIELVQKLYKLYIEKTIDKDDLSKLKYILLASQKDQLCRAYSLCFSEDYGFQVFGEFNISMCYISADYLNCLILENKQNRSNIVDFLKSLGVMTQISPVECVDDNIKYLPVSNKFSYSSAIEKYPEYIEFIYRKYIEATRYAKYTNQHFLRLTPVYCLPWTVQKEYWNFTKTFWESVLLRWEQEKFYGQPAFYDVWHGRDSFPIPNLFDFYVHRKQCFPVTSGELALASESILNLKRYKDIAGDALPVLALDVKIPDSVVEILGIKKQLSASDYFVILENIKNQDSAKKVDYERLNKTYQTLVSQLEILDDTKALEKWKISGGKLLACDGHFYPYQELYYVDAPGFQKIVEASRFVWVPEPQTPEFLDLMSLLGVTRVEADELHCKCESRQLSSVTDFLRWITPFLSIIVSFQRHQDVEEVHQHLQSTIYKLTGYKVQRLSLELVKEGEQILCMDRRAWIDIGSNHLYYVGSERSSITMYALAEVLCHYLDIDCVRELQTLLLETETGSICDWLSEEGYEVSWVEDTPNFSELDDSNAPVVEVSVEEQVVVTDDVLPVYIEPDPERRQEIGRKGEEFIYRELVNFYKNQSATIAYISHGFEGDDFKVEWLNKNGESGQPYDFIVRHRGKTFYIEVKATTTSLNISEKIPLYISPSEWAILLDSQNSSMVARVFDVESSQPSFFLIELKDLSELLNEID